jgi:hypothetical protein
MTQLAVDNTVSIIGGMFVLLTLAAAGILDLFLAGYWGPYATISEQIRGWCARWPVLYVALAWLLFHLTALPSATLALRQAEKAVEREDAVKNGEKSQH